MDWVCGGPRPARVSVETDSSDAYSTTAARICNRRTAGTEVETVSAGIGPANNAANPGYSGQVNGAPTIGLFSGLISRIISAMRIDMAQ